MISIASLVRRIARKRERERDLLHAGIYVCIPDVPLNLHKHAYVDRDESDPLQIATQRVSQKYQLLIHVLYKPLRDGDPVCSNRDGELLCPAHDIKVYEGSRCVGRDYPCLPGIE